MSILTMHHGLMAGIKQGPVGNFVHIGQNDYPYVQIGSQLWMAENLREEAGVDGTNWTYNSTLHQWFYNQNNTSDTLALIAIPEGWHLPSKAEWDSLFTYCGGRTAETATKLKSTTGWGTNTAGTISYAGTDDYGFNLKAGTNNDNGITSVYLKTTSYLAYFSGNNAPQSGYSSSHPWVAVRLVKDAT